MARWLGGGGSHVPSTNSKSKQIPASKALPEYADSQLLRFAPGPASPTTREVWKASNGSSSFQATGVNEIKVAMETHNVDPGLIHFCLLSRGCSPPKVINSINRGLFIRGQHYSEHRMLLRELFTTNLQAPARKVAQSPERHVSAAHNPCKPQRSAREYVGFEGFN